jgi:hypothetical protein
MPVSLTDASREAGILTIDLDQNQDAAGKT